MTVTFHEGKVCDALLRYLEKREGGLREDIYSPENKGHSVPIDLSCRLNGRMLAIEHTGIEPFSNQIELSVHLKAFFDPVRDALSDILPKTETYELLVPVDATDGLKRHEIPHARKALIEWIRVTAPSLPVSRMGRYDSPQLNVHPAGVPFRVSLYRFSHVIETLGHLMVVATIGERDLPRERRARLARACLPKKFPNLMKWKRDYGARTILVLEDIDFQLSNPVLVGEALRDILSHSTEVPDAIYYVFTAATDAWWVSPLLVDNNSALDAGGLIYDFEIDPATLVSLTGR